MQISNFITRKTSLEVTSCSIINKYQKYKFNVSKQYTSLEAIRMVRILNPCYNINLWIIVPWVPLITMTNAEIECMLAAALGPCSDRKNSRIQKRLNYSENFQGE